MPNMLRVKKGVGAGLLALVGLSACGGGDDGSNGGALCSSIGLQAKIANGAACAGPAQSPVILLAVVQGGSASTCSGVLLTASQVLTAAHCMAGASAASAALWRADGSSTGVPASRWAVHPGFAEAEDGYVNDAAVVTLSSPLPNPTMPLLVSQPTAAGQDVFISGWGAPGFELAVGSAQLSIVTDAQIGYTYSGEGSNTCFGDSGGPAYRIVGGRPGVVGLTSSGTVANCGAGDRSLFTNTQGSAVLNFIRSQAPAAEQI